LHGNEWQKIDNRQKYKKISFNFGKEGSLHKVYAIFEKLPGLLLSNYIPVENMLKIPAMMLGSGDPVGSQ
jgi:hypothetical protein